MTTTHDRDLAHEFDRWADDGMARTMERSHGRFTELALDRWELGAEHRVLDVGCGNGWAVRQMIERGAGDGAGVDISAEMVALATEPGTYVQATADHLPFEASTFTHVLSVEALYYTADPDAVLREWARVARSGAQLMVLLDLYRESPCWNIWPPLFPFPVHVRSEAEWSDALAAAGWKPTATDRILDPAGPRPEAEFEPADWAPSYENYLAQKRAGTLCLRGVRVGD